MDNPTHPDHRKTHHKTPPKSDPTDTANRSPESKPMPIAAKPPQA